MKFTCTKDNLNKVLNLVSPIAGRQGHLPVLLNVLIVADGSKVEFIATNLEVAIKADLRAKVDSHGSFTVPAKTLADYVNLLSESQIEVKLDNNELEVTSGNASTRIKGMPADEFPIVPEVDEKNVYTVSVDKFKDALSKTVVAVAKNEIRPELSGVYMEFFGPRYDGLVLAATDSYRLAETKLVVDQGKSETKSIVPARTVFEIIRLLSLSKNEGAESQARVWVSDRQIALRYNEFEMTSRLVEGNYPDYSQIIPSKFSTKAIFSADVMVKNIKAAGLFTATGVNAVSFDLNTKSNTVAVSSTNAQTGQHNSEIDAEVGGEENSILLNHRYVLDGLQHIEDDVVFSVNSADAPCMFQQKGKDDYLYIVMPIRQ